MTGNEEAPARQRQGFRYSNHTLQDMTPINYSQLSPQWLATFMVANTILNVPAYAKSVPSEWQRAQLKRFLNRLGARATTSRELDAITSKGAEMALAAMLVSQKTGSAVGEAAGIRVLPVQLAARSPEATE